jgi:uncharacterized delta-60 repeat protein
VARYNTDGTLDTSFDNDGRLTTDFFGSQDTTNGTDDRVNSVAVQPNGKIVAAGRAYSPSALGDFGIVRYNSNGSLDATFGLGGKVTTGFFGDDEAFAIAIQSDEKLVVSGKGRNTTTLDDFAMIRYLSDGTLDTSFGIGGKVTTDFYDDEVHIEFDGARCMAIQPDGKIVVAGSAINRTGSSDFAIARYSSSPPNQPPTVLGQTISRRRGDDGTVSNIVLASDDLTPAGNLTVALGLVPSGINVSNVTNNNGIVTATIASDCSAPLGDNFISLQVTDSGGLVATGTLTVNVTENPTPSVTITSPPSGAVYQIGSTLNFAGGFLDNTGDVHTAQWGFSSASSSFSQTGTVDEINKTVVTSRAFNSVGVYLVRVSVTDECGNIGTATTVNSNQQAKIIIYDPNAGFVRGNGSINSPLGAYRTNPNLTEKVKFKFDSEYQNGSSLPIGSTEFQFKTANFDFNGTTYNWLLISGAKAQYEGSGTINGSGNYGFILTAIDGHVNGGIDKFRIKIWNKSTGNIIYDNQVTGDISDTADPVTPLNGGNIIIH